MTLEVKTFIEQYIDLIESEDWEKLLTEWYLHKKISWYDEEYAELLTVLVNSNIISEINYLDDIAEKVIFEFIHNDVESRLNSNNTNDINLEETVNKLNSKLCLRLKTLHNIFSSVCDSFPNRLKETSSDKLRYNVLEV